MCYLTRRPWKGGKDRMAVVKAFTISCLPFILAEAVTGVLSFVTGELRIPPTVGLGTAVDMVIFLAGVVVIVLRALKARPMKSKIGEDSERD
jgi:hypothetical protein